MIRRMNGSTIVLENIQTPPAAVACDHWPLSRAAAGNMVNVASAEREIDFMVLGKCFA
jgi:hypothetical protein